MLQAQQVWWHSREKSRRRLLQLHLLNGGGLGCLVGGCLVGGLSLLGGGGLGLLDGRVVHGLGLGLCLGLGLSLGLGLLLRQELVAMGGLERRREVGSGGGMTAVFGGIRVVSGARTPRD